MATYKDLLNDVNIQKLHLKNILDTYNRLRQQDKDKVLKSIIESAELLKDTTKSTRLNMTEGKKDFSNKKAIIKTIINNCKVNGYTKEQTAYTLATVAHETNHTFEPVKEAYWQNEDWRAKHLRYYPYYGRGYVQITWKSNYQKLGKRIGVPNLADNPDLALDPNIALRILVIGLKEGLFSGVGLPDFINETKVDYFNARKCVNGLDRAEYIANLARGFEDIVKKEWDNV